MMKLGPMTDHTGHVPTRPRSLYLAAVNDRPATGCLIFSGPVHRIEPSRDGARILTMSHPCGIIRTTRFPAS